jgi:hypothetical protein
MGWKTLLATALIAAPLLAAVPAFGGGAPQWPSEAEDRLDEVASHVLDLQRALAAARHRGDRDEIENLEKEFERAQEERLNLLRSAHKL